jgi:hypothetical protein
MSCSRHSVALHRAEQLSEQRMHVLKDCVYYHTSFHEPRLSGASVAPTSQICESLLILL